MNTFLNKVFVIVYSLVNKKDSEMAVLSVASYLSWNMIFTLIATNFILKGVELKREATTYIGIFFTLLILYIAFYKYYFYKNRFILLINSYDILPKKKKDFYKFISISIFIIVQISVIAAAQYAFLTK